MRGFVEFLTFGLLEDGGFRRIYEPNTLVDAERPIICVGVPRTALVYVYLADASRRQLAARSDWWYVGKVVLREAHIFSSTLLQRIIDLFFGILLRY
jgi:hypothetical protein